ncbi:MAG: alpha/beta hydrolase [Tannerella sp.]|nr:alpha/beta hydrolase [Tannerella sp.]
MKLKQLILLTGLLLINYADAFSQSVQCQKQEFVYKSVKGHDIKATIFLPASKEKLPVVIYFHGGGFIFGNRDQGLEIPLKEQLLANGYAVVSADYRLAPETKLDEILKDVSDVIKWIKQNGQQKYNIDTDKVAVAGGSAGGYLALSSGFNPDFMPDAIIAISTPTGFSTANIQMGDLTVLDQPGPYDIVKDSVVSYGDYDSRMDLWRFLGRNRLALFEIFGFDPAKEPEKLERYTLTNNVKSNFPPTLLIHAKNDRLIDLQQVNEFYIFLTEKQVKAELHLVENGHSSELIKQHPEVIEKIIDFLKTQMQ